MTNKKQRPQSQKSYVERVQNLRGGSTAQPHKPKTDYRRRPKHKNQGWDY